MNEIFTNNEYSLKFVEPLSMILAGTSQVILGVVEANEIIELIDDELKVNIDLTRLFAGNVRGFLENTQLNKDIRTTIEKESYSFLSKNNGIVILCDKITVQPKNKSALIANPVIINGQQTVASIYLYAKKASQKDNIKVVVKIIEIDSQKKEEEALEIAKASNSSNVIDELDLLSNRPLIKSIKKFFGDRNIYIKVKDGEILNDVFFSGDKKIDLSNLIKTWVAIFLERPNDAKVTMKNILIFSDAYSKKNGLKSKILLNDNNFDKLIDTFFMSYQLMESAYVSKIQKYFQEMSYYVHAQYFILYLLKKEFPKLQYQVVHFLK